MTGANSRSATNIPLLTPGQWVDTFPAVSEDEVTSRFRIKPPQGWTPHVTATGVVDIHSSEDDSGSTAKIVLEAVTPNGDSCESDQDFTMWVDLMNEPLIASITPDCEDEAII